MGLIDDQMKELPWEGKIILVQGTTIYMKPGEDSGVKVGDTFAVYSQGQELIDPDTGLSLGSEESKIGTIQVTSLVSGGKAAKAAAKMVAARVAMFATSIFCWPRMKWFFST